LDPSQFILQVPLRNILTQTRAWSPFVEVNWAFMDGKARLGVEARYSDETKREVNLASGGAGGVGGFGGNVLQDDFTAFTPRVTLEYDLSDDHMLFGSIAQGVKAGGFNGTATLPQNLTYGQDENWTYEFGSRNVFYDGRLQLNATLFYIAWSDLQISAQDDGNPNPLPISIIKNLGDVTSVGVEIDSAWSVNDSLTLYGTLFLGDAEYDNGTLDLRWGRIPSVCDDVVCSSSGDISGNTLERQADTQITFGLDWRDQLRGDFDYYVRADVGYQSEMYAEAVNLATVPDRTLVNATFGIVNERYELRLWARNLLDEEYVSSVAVGAPNVQYNSYLGEKRTYGLTLDVNFGLGN
jgi:iron complex outermembrane receptor protein